MQKQYNYHMHAHTHTKTSTTGRLISHFKLSSILNKHSLNIQKVKHRATHQLQAAFKRNTPNVMLVVPEFDTHTHTFHYLWANRIPSAPNHPCQCMNSLIHAGKWFQAQNYTQFWLNHKVLNHTKIHPLSLGLFLYMCLPPLHSLPLSLFSFICLSLCLPVSLSLSLFLSLKEGRRKTQTHTQN